MRKLRILLADDHPLLREGTRLFIDREPDCDVCAVASDGREALEQTAEHHPDVVVLDLHMPGTDARSVVLQLKKKHPTVEIVVYSGTRGEEIVDQLFQAGVKSFIRKTDPSELLIAAIRAAGEHKLFVTPAIGELIFRKALAKQSHAELTSRELEIVRLIADGCSNKQIAAQLSISTRTAETHRAAIMRKLEASSTADVVRYAIRSGVIEA